MITVEHLRKQYGELVAVDDLSFEIGEGHVYGFLGPNGAGKSTTMNIMTGCLSATAGRVRVDGGDHITHLELREEDGRATARLGTDLPDPCQLSRALFFAFAASGIPLLELAQKKVGLEDIFLELTEQTGQPAQEGREPDEAEKEERS